MRLQTGLAGTPIAATPRWIVVPALLETTGEQVLTALAATKVDDVNPCGNAGLSLIVERRLDADSSTTWYVATDATQLPHLEYGYLQKAPGPQTLGRWGFEICPA